MVTVTLTDIEAEQTKFFSVMNKNVVLMPVNMHNKFKDGTWNLDWNNKKQNKIVFTILLLQIRLGEKWSTTVLFELERSTPQFPTMMVF